MSLRDFFARTAELWDRLGTFILDLTIMQCLITWVVVVVFFALISLENSYTDRGG